MNSTPTTVTTTKYLIFLNSVIWLVLAIIIASGFHPAIPEGDLIRWGMALVSFLTFVFLIGMYQIMMRYGGIAYYLILVMLALLSFLTIADQFGFVDLFVLLINLITLGLMIKDRTYYLRPEQGIAT